MYHLPAYVALERRLLQKLVAVVMPRDASGPRRLAAAGAARVLVVGGGLSAEPGLEIVSGPIALERLPLRDGSVDAVTFLEGFTELDGGPRSALVDEARRVLRRRGFFAVWAPAHDATLWRTEDELRRRFEHVQVFAQLEWRGVSLTPLFSGRPDSPPASDLREGLLRTTVPAQGYLLIASQDELQAPECVVLPTGASEARAAPSTLAPAGISLPPTPVPDLDDLFAEAPTPLAPPTAVPQVTTPPLPGSEALRDVLRERVTALEREREGLLAKALKFAEDLERSREEKARTETELHAARLRIESLERAPEDSRMHSLASLMRVAQMSGPTPAFETHELVDEVAPLVAPESGRVTTDAALDRNRLREELARRTAELQALETRVLQQEEELRREHLENVRLVTDVDRMREQVERSRAIEQERVQELERLGHELRKLELAHAELQGAQAGAEPSEGREQPRPRDRTSAEVIRRRDRELAEATRTVRELRRSVEDHASMAAELRGELAVLQVHVQRLEETVPTLQERLREQQRKTLDQEEEAAVLQRRLEEAVADQEHLRGRLRRQRQELDVLAGAKQGAEVELFRLRRELEAKHQAIEQLQQIVALAATRFEGGERGPVSEAARGEALHLRAAMAEQAAEHAQALARSEAEHQRNIEAERQRLRRARLEGAIRAEEMEYMLFQLDTAEQRIWEMNDATDRSAARLAAGLAQLEKQKEQYDDLVDELEVTRNLLVQAQAKTAEMGRLLDSERTRVARLSVGPIATSDPEVFDVSVDDEDLGPPLRRQPDEADPLAGINFDDEVEPENLVARLAASSPEITNELTLGPDSSTSGPAFALPSDTEFELEEDDLPPPGHRVVVVPDEDEEEEEIFAIDTDAWVEEQAEDQDGEPSREPPPPPPSSGTREHPTSRIVIEVLDEDEVWPDDGVLQEEEEEKEP